MSEADSTIEIGPPTDADMDDLFGLLNLAFDDWGNVGGDVERRDHLAWKCNSSPSSMAHHTVARLNGTIIGSILRVDREVRIGDRILPAQTEFDSSVSPRFQGRGLYNRMKLDGSERSRSRGVAIHIQFPGHPTTVRAWVNAGLIARPIAFDVLMKPIDVTAAASRMGGLPGALPRPIAAAGLRLLALVSRLRHGRSRPTGGSETIVTVEQFDDSVDSLAESAASEFDFFAVRDRDYLNWRYCDRRGGEFTVRQLHEGDELVGYSVLRTVSRRAFIADILARSGRLDAVEQLLWDADRMARDRGADTIVCRLPANHPYKKTFLRAGFLRSREQAQFDVIPLAFDQSELDFLTRSDVKTHARSAIPTSSESRRRRRAPQVR